MNCTICGQAALPGAMLCQPCRAALKRARYVSVQALPPVSIIGAGRPRRRARAPAAVAPAATAGRAAPSPTPSRRPLQLRHPAILGGAAIAVLAAVAYLGQQRGPPPPAPDASSAPAGLALPAGDLGTAPTPVPVSAGEAQPVAPPPSGKAPPAAAGPQRPGRTPVDARTTAEAPASPPPGAPATRPSAPAAREVTLDSFGPGPAIVRTAAPQAPRAAPPAVRSPPPPDRWARMRDALAACDREGGFSGFLCDQRVRMDGCEGYWGRVPDCPAPPENPGGQ